MDDFSLDEGIEGIDWNMLTDGLGGSAPVGFDDPFSFFPDEGVLHAGEETIGNSTSLLFSQDFSASAQGPPTQRSTREPRRKISTARAAAAAADKVAASSLSGSSSSRSRAKSVPSSSSSKTLARPTNSPQQTLSLSSSSSSTLPVMTNVQQLASSDAIANEAAAGAARALRSNSEHLLKSLTAQSLSAFRSAFFGGSLSDDEGGGDDDDDDDCDDGAVNDSNTRKRKRAKRHNPDAQLIASATEEQMRLLNIESKSKEGKKQRRKIRNRMSALLHRERKKMYIEALEAMVQEKDNRIKALEEQLNIVSKSSSSSSSSSAATTDEESSITSSNPSTRSGSPVPPSPLSSNGASTQSVQIARGFRSLFPMLSVVCLVCVAMFDGRISQSPLSPSSSSSSSALQSQSQALVPRALFQQAQQPDVMEAPSSTLSLLPAPAPATTLQVVQVPETTHRRLLEWTPPPATHSLHWDAASESNDTTSDLLSSLSSSKHALWRYAHRGATLYPRYTSQILSNRTTFASAGAVNQSKQKQNNLRSRPVAGTVLPSAQHESSFSKSLISAPVASTKLPVLVASSSSMNTPRLEPPVASVPAMPVAVASVNRVLMTNGKALLDPALTLTIASAVDDGAASKKPETTPFSSALSAWRGPTSEQTTSSTYGSHSQPQKPVIYSTSADSQVLVMLLPASSIRWGKAWADSEGAEGTTEALLNTFNATETGTYGAQDGQEGPMWVEIGCSVFKVQIVRGVEDVTSSF